ncbi:MAG TPA: hypothetical protein VMR99_00450 [Candidatus Paceibacterota bacterium]|nr:hypothetical protein [Candidatus Paceibacterota bacterium]
MALIKKLIPFLVIFGTIFYFIRTSSIYNSHLLFSNVDGTPYLYAVVGTVFGVLAGFAIQKEWEEWNALTDAVRGEVDGLEKLYLWSSNFPDKIKNAIHANIKRYLALIIKEGWRYSEKGEKSPEVEAVITDLNNSIYGIFNEAPQLMPTSFALLSIVLNNRSARLQHSAEHMPPLLRNTLRFAAFLLIGLSMFIAIRDIWLAFLFTASIASLAYAIFLVLIDLDNPLKPGDWHITTKDYKALLEKIG